MRNYVKTIIIIINNSVKNLILKSNSPRKVRAEIWGKKPHINIHGSTPSIFQAEVLVTLVGVQQLIGFKNTNITIFSDSQVALIALNKI